MVVARLVVGVVVARPVVVVVGRAVVVVVAFVVVVVGAAVVVVAATEVVVVGGADVVVVVGAAVVVVGAAVVVVVAAVVVVVGAAVVVVVALVVVVVAAVVVVVGAAVVVVVAFVVVVVAFVVVVVAAVVVVVAAIEWQLRQTVTPSLFTWIEASPFAVPPAPWQPAQVSGLIVPTPLLPVMWQVRQVNEACGLTPAAVCWTCTPVAVEPPSTPVVWWQPSHWLPLPHDAVPPGPNAPTLWVSVARPMTIAPISVRTTNRTTYLARIVPPFLECSPSTPRTFKPAATENETRARQVTVAR